MSFYDPFKSSAQENKFDEILPVKEESASSERDAQEERIVPLEASLPEEIVSEPIVKPIVETAKEVSTRLKQQAPTDKKTIRGNNALSESLLKIFAKEHPNITPGGIHGNVKKYVDKLVDENNPRSFTSLLKTGALPVEQAKGMVSSTIDLFKSISVGDTIEVDGSFPFTVNDKIVELIKNNDYFRHALSPISMLWASDEEKAKIEEMKKKAEQEKQKRQREQQQQSTPPSPSGTLPNSLDEMFSQILISASSHNQPSDVVYDNIQRSVGVVSVRLGEQLKNKLSGKTTEEADKIILDAWNEHGNGKKKLEEYVKRGTFDDGSAVDQKQEKWINQILGEYGSLTRPFIDAIVENTQGVPTGGSPAPDPNKVKIPPGTLGPEFEPRQIGYEYWRNTLRSAPGLSIIKKTLKHLQALGLDTNGRIKGAPVVSPDLIDTIMKRNLDGKAKTFAETGNRAEYDAEFEDAVSRLNLDGLPPQWTRLARFEDKEFTHHASVMSGSQFMDRASFRDGLLALMEFYYALKSKSVRDGQFTAWRSSFIDWRMLVARPHFNVEWVRYFPEYTVDDLGIIFELPPREEEFQWLKIHEIQDSATDTTDIGVNSSELYDALNNEENIGWFAVAATETGMRYRNVEKNRKRRTRINDKTEKACVTGINKEPNIVGNSKAHDVNKDEFGVAVDQCGMLKRIKRFFVK